MAFLNAVGGAIQRARPDVVAFLTGGDGAAAGPFLILGPAGRVSSVGPKVAKLLEGRGGGKGGRFQGKASRLEHRAQALSLFRD